MSASEKTFCIELNSVPRPGFEQLSGLSATIDEKPIDFLNFLDVFKSRDYVVSNGMFLCVVLTGFRSFWYLVANCASFGARRDL